MTPFFFLSKCQAIPSFQGSALLENDKNVEKAPPFLSLERRLKKENRPKTRLAVQSWRLQRSLVLQMGWVFFFFSVIFFRGSFERSFGESRCVGAEKTSQVDGKTPPVQRGFLSLTESELRDGWVLLFDGKTIFGWEIEPLQAQHALTVPDPEIRIQNGAMTILTQVPLRLSTPLFCDADFEIVIDYRLVPLENDSQAGEEALSKTPLFLINGQVPDAWLDSNSEETAERVDDGFRGAADSNRVTPSEMNAPQIQGGVASDSLVDVEKKNEIETDTQTKIEDETNVEIDKEAQAASNRLRLNRDNLTFEKSGKNRLELVLNRGTLVIESIRFRPLNAHVLGINDWASHGKALMREPGSENVTAELENVSPEKEVTEQENAHDLQNAAAMQEKAALDEKAMVLRENETAQGEEGFFLENQGYLESRGSFSDFWGQLEFQSWVDEARRAETFCNSGLFFRCVPGSQTDGYECQINNLPNESDRSKFLGNDTGSIFRRKAARRVTDQDNQRTFLTLMACGNLFRSWVNGIPTVSWIDERAPHENPRQGRRDQAGTLQLQGHDPWTKIQFFQIRVSTSDEAL